LKIKCSLSLGRVKVIKKRIKRELVVIGERAPEYILSVGDEITRFLISMRKNLFIEISPQKDLIMI